MMGTLKRHWPYAVALLILLTALLALAAAAELDALRSLISSGGGRVGGDGLALHSAVGQPLVGWSRNGVSLCSGFLCGPGVPEHTVFLPTLMRRAEE